MQTLPALVWMCLSVLRGEPTFFGCAPRLLYLQGPVLGPFHNTFEMRSDLVQRTVQSAFDIVGQ